MAAKAAIPAALSAIVALGGCTLGGPPTVRPDDSLPHAGSAQPTASGRTSLIVRTEKFYDLNLGDPDIGTLQRPTGYTVYDAAGNRVRYVKNFIGLEDTEPSEIVLPPGKYLILLEKPYEHSPLFWVLLTKGELTTADVSDLPSAARGSEGK